jgi:2'-5' RNA ligase
MPWRVSRCGRCPPWPWCVVKTDDGELEGCHSSEEKAEAQRRALNANEATIMFASEDEQAASEVVEERESELSAFESAMGEFAAEYRRRLSASKSLGAIEPLWVELTYEMMAEPFAEEATAQAIAVALASGLDPTAISQTQVDEMAAEHTAAFAAFGGFLASVVAFKQIEKEPIVSVAGLPSTPEEVDATIAPWLVAERLATITERSVVAIRNGATNLVVSAGRRFLDAARRSTLGRFLGATVPEPPPEQEAARTVPTKKWLTVMDSRVRPKHASAHNQTVPADETFLIGGYPARYPGDPLLPPAQRVNCRCFITPGDADSDVWVGWVNETRANIDCSGGGLIAQGAVPVASGAACEFPEIGGLARSTIAPPGIPEFTIVETWGPTMSAMSTRPKHLMRWGQATGTFLITGPDHTDGVMLACRPSKEQRAALAMDGGLPEEELHLTLGSFGKVGDLNDPERFVQVLTDTVNEFFKGNGSVTGQVSGIATFEANNERPLVALIDAPGLGALRTFLIEELRMVGAMDGNTDLDAAEGHDFQPHITLGYDPTEDDLETALERVAVPITFDAIELVVGTTRYEYPFAEPEEEQPMRAAPSPVEAAADPQDLSEGTWVVFDEDPQIGGVVVGMGDRGAMVRVWMFQDGEWIETDETVEAPAEAVTVVSELPMPESDEDGEEDDEGDMAAPPPVDEGSAESTENRRRADVGDYDWEGVLVVEGTESGDRRMIAEGALTWRDLPLTLMAQFQTPETGGHALSVPAGSIWEIERVDATLVGRGFFDSGEDGDKLRRMMEEGTMKGVSVDIDMVSSDDDGEMMVLLEGRIMGATATAFPAFQEAVLELVEVSADQASALVASGATVWEIDGSFYTKDIGDSA